MVDCNYPHFGKTQKRFIPIDRAIWYFKLDCNNDNPTFAQFLTYFTDQFVVNPARCAAMARQIIKGGPWNH